jgi:pyruvate dehydrogenase E1 component beta subunit
VFVETVALYGQRGSVPIDAGFAIPLGQAEVKRPGDDVTLIAYGPAVVESMLAAAKLEADGVSAEVLDLRTLVPLDVPAILESVSRTKRAVVAHFATQFAGPGAEIAAVVDKELFGQLAAPVERVGARFTPIPAAAGLEAEVFPTADRIAAAARRTLGTDG